MPTRKPFWDILTDNQKQTCIDSIIRYFDSERDEQIGLIAAQEFLNMALEELFPYIYNKGIEDAKALLRDKMADIEVDLDLLRRT